MKTIYLSRLCHKSGNQSVSLATILLAAVALLGSVGGSALWLGYEMGRESQYTQSDSDRANELIKSVLSEQQLLLDDTRRTTRDHIDALALRLGQLQSRILRLDALGEQLAVRGKLDSDEFNFAEPPAVGGLDNSSQSDTHSLNELVAEMEQLSVQLDDREQKLDLLAGLITTSKVQDEMSPGGRPTKKGWISSYYGTRKDPFSGKKSFHHGVDIAGKENSEIVAVASGMVTWAGKKSGFGYHVEIMHADGYVTKYAHNNEIFVSEGDLVEKGQVIGLMGSSGRSTGPHVHFEIARNGKTVNPLKFIKKKSN